MDESIKILPNFKKFNSYIDDVKQGISPIMLSGLTDVAKIHFAYSTFFYTEKPICIVTYNELQAKKIIKEDEKNILVVGDQIFTDILGANLAKMKCVLVEPKDKNEPFSIKLKRVFEVPFRFVSKFKCKKKDEIRSV